MVKVERGKRKRVWECPEWADNDLNFQNQQLDETLKENGEWGDLWETNLKDRKAMRQGFEARIQDLIKLLEDPQAFTSHERHLREEVEISFKILPANWK